ncbi:hypothetical protein [Mycobacteroides abscessus]|uniref:hypothetical protein n=1 Tax=Mycobacteroides abscessus TaxID=36809 RepID=UPI000929582A|nr:hypothetical protein [Mycobacteroides abscessus]DAZ90354.1 TPA_asm: minor tail protein [Mycobacterium phage prophiFSQJ01-1]SII41501.1 Uncharacterised protein [Mycobacteroides abscessus subsp. abscessus]SIK13658.1 Uncharacterised protein [Mycobacteroides abscessus subsp. abscessus]SIN25677.1 Uncharacterised protein [Mycobacteroides abscessus subsp. abscessus]SLI51233.1 Uncharacterised protein [Mycobacteroides abscessus subsp. abscessus]
MSTNPFIIEPDYYENKILAMWVSGDGRKFHTHGDIQGHEGIWNAKGQVKGIYDAPVKTTWKSGAFQDGATQKGRKVLQRDMQLGFHCIDTQGRTAEENESEFRKIFGYEIDEYDDEPEPTTLGIETEKSGLRMLDVLMYEQPDTDFDVDPIKQQHINLILKLRAGQPMWYEEPVISKFMDGGTSASGFIEVENPTDQPMRQKWILTRGEWEVPDFSWRGKKYRRKPGGAWRSRMISVPPITDVQGGAVISLNKQDLMIRDVHYTNMLPLMNGKFFMHVIPPYTPKQLLPISYKNAPAGGAMAQLIQPRLWSRPWGLE